MLGIWILVVLIIFVPRGIGSIPLTKEHTVQLADDSVWEISRVERVKIQMFGEAMCNISQNVLKIRENMISLDALDFKGYGCSM